MSALGRRSSARAAPVEAPRRLGSRLLAELERQRHAARRLETTGRVAVEVARDVDKLAAALLASTFALTEALGYDERVLPRLDQIRIAGERTAELARQLLALGEPAPLRVAVVELGQLVERLGPLLRSLVGDAIELEVVSSRKPSRCCVELGQLEALVVGLIAGCLDAMPDGGRLRIETGVQLVGAGESPGRVPGGSYAVLSLLRYSAGVDEGELPRTFEPGCGSLAPNGGAGLDDATTSQLVAECGGYWVTEQEPARGSLQLYFPSTEEPVSSSMTEAVPSMMPGGFETVLVVADNRANRVSTRRLLKSRGYRVIEAGSAQQALLASKRHVGRIAALVADVVLADMNGYLLAERLRSERPELKLLFMTSYPGRSEEGGIRLVGTEVVRKPFTAATLCRTLRGLLDASG